jgi:sugar lactone lactonase YvrE
MCLTLRIALTAILVAVVAVAVSLVWVSLQKPGIDIESFSVEKKWVPEPLPAVENAKGPESYDYDPNGGGPYAGFSDGRILKWVEDERRWIDFAFSSANRDGCGPPEMEHICGRPLGIRFNQSSGDLYIADAYLGLLKVGPKGGVATVISNETEGIPFKFTNGLDFDLETGVLYFTHSSSKYDRRNYILTLFTGDSSGRLMKYDPSTNQVTVLLNNLTLPNGVLLSDDGNYIYVVETLKLRVLKYWIKTEKAGTVEVFAQFQGAPDNIHRSPRGGYWVAIYSKKDKMLATIQRRPAIGRFLSKLPIDPMKIYAFMAKFRKTPGVGLRLDENGEVVEEFFDESIGALSEFMEKDGYVWVGSVNLPVATRYKVAE